MPTDTDALAPNHHAHHPGFAGPSGLALGVVMALFGGHRARLACRLAGVGPADTVVDVGCGPGSAVRRAARTGATAIGVDPAGVMRRVAEVLTTGRSRTRFVQGTAEALPLDDGTATVVWSIATVHHWHDIEAGLREARRVLRPGGRLLAVERRCAPGAHGLGSHGWTPAQAEAFAASCRAHGFDAVRVEEHPGGRHANLAVHATVP